MVIIFRFVCVTGGLLSFSWAKDSITADRKKALKRRLEEKRQLHQSSQGETEGGAKAE